MAANLRASKLRAMQQTRNGLQKGAHNSMLTIVTIKSNNNHKILIAITSINHYEVISKSANHKEISLNDRYNEEGRQGTPV